MNWLQYWLWDRWERRTFITPSDMRLIERTFGISYDNNTGVWSKLERK